MESSGDLNVGENVVVPESSRVLREVQLRDALTELGDLFSTAITALNARMDRFEGSKSPSDSLAERGTLVMPRRGEETESVEQRPCWAERSLSETFTNYPITDWEPLDGEPRTEGVQVHRVSEWI